MTRYVLQEEDHGAGGFGKIRKGFDQILERSVAVKILDPIFTSFPDEEDRERFIREGRTLAALSHPNIPAIYDIRTTDEFRIFFEFIDGVNIRQMIDSGPIGLNDAKRWIVDVANALKHAHSKGVIHRDLKPENLIVGPDQSNCYLVDFGIALNNQDAQRITKFGYVIGTPGYMSPEQEAGDQDIDYRTDIYSLGICLYEMLSGKIVPKGHYPRLSDSNDLIPGAIDELILSCIKPKDSRLHSLDLFISKLNLALKPSKSLSQILTSGTLLEICQALEEETPESFIDWPEGQRTLLLVRCNDLMCDTRTAIDDFDPLDPAKTELLQNLVRIGIYIDSENYGFIIENALFYGFLKKISASHYGNPKLRSVLSETALTIIGKNFPIFADKVIAFIKAENLEKLHRWQRHELRDLTQKLMANTNCQKEANDCGLILREINKLQRESITA